MTVLALVTTGLALTSGFLLAWVGKLRRELRGARRISATERLAGAEEAAGSQGTNERLARQALLLQTRLEDCQQELTALIYSVSHDLRAPLRSIGGFSQALAEDYGPRLDANAQDYLRRVRTSTLHLNDLIDELLTLSGIVRAPLRSGPVDLGTMARGIAAELTADDPTRRVEWSIPATVPAQGDPDLLATALRHLLGNAWKFSAGQAVARVELRVMPPGTAPEEPETTVYAVRDNGAGFDPQYAGKLFGVFQRLHAAGEFPGRGVGLATVQRIVRRHGGRVWAAAEPGGGAVFSFTLDAAPDDVPGRDADEPGLPAVAVPAPELADTLEPKPFVA